MPAILYLPLPFMLWAAFRFGPRGASTASTVVCLLAIVGAAHGRGPFATGSGAEGAFALQLFLFFVVVFLLCLAAVMTERNEAERALRESEDRYRAVVDSHTDLLCRYLPDTTITFVNAAYCRFFGRKAAELIGRKFIEFVPEAAREAVLANIDRAIREQRPVTLEHEVTLSDGSTRWQQWIDEPVRSEGLATGEMQGVGRDITERKRLEDNRRELSHATRLVMVGELTASLAHEINQPLGAILSNVEAAEMLLDAKADASDELRRILADIRRDDIRASEVIGHVRSLLRKRAVERRAIDLNRLIEDVLRFVASDAARRQVALEARLSAIPQVIGDRVHLQQVLLNLILNGLEAMADTPRARRRLVVFSGRAASGGVEVCVSDAGHGIAPEHMNGIFDSFMSTKADGMGLGLSIARSIVEAHGGRIEARNNAMAGATVRFELPASSAQPPTDAPSAPPTTGGRS
jgi:PAS domain S-box-containing protein